MDTAKRTVWVRACDTFNTIEKVAEAVARRLGHPTESAAKENGMSCGCTRGYLYKVKVHLTRVPTSDEVVTVVEPELVTEPPGRCGVLNCEIVDLEMSVRLYNCLERLRLIYLGSLVQLTERYLLRCPNFGRKSLRELKELLAEKGLSLNTKLLDWKAADKKVAFNNDWRRVGLEFLTRGQVLAQCGLREDENCRVMYGVHDYFDGAHHYFREAIEYKVLKPSERVLVVSGMEFVTQAEDPEGRSSQHGG
jgi:hypothetical protein